MVLTGRDEKEAIKESRRWRCEKSNARCPSFPQVFLTSVQKAVQASRALMSTVSKFSASKKIVKGLRPHNNWPIR